MSTNPKDPDFDFNAFLLEPLEPYDKKTIAWLKKERPMLWEATKHLHYKALEIVEKETK